MKTTRTLITVAFAAVGLVTSQNVLAEHHRENIAMNVERQLIEIEVDVLVDKFSELTKRMHQLSLERLEMEVEIEFVSNEAEKSEISRQLKKLRLLQNRLEEKQLQTRDHIHERSQQVAEFHIRDEHEEEEEGHHAEAEQIEDELHHLRQEIEDLREAGKLDRAERLQRRAEELIEQYSKQERRRNEFAGKPRHFNRLMEERREAIAHLEELHEALEQIEGDNEEAEEERDALERKAVEVEEFLDAINRKLEELEAAQQKEGEEE